MSEELEVSRIVTERLGRAGIPYMLTGSLAMSHYAVPRMTRDIDLVVELSGADADRVCDLFEADFYVDRDTVRRAVEARDTFNMIHTALVVKVDVVVAPEDLIISKLDWARESRSAVQLRCRPGSGLSARMDGAARAGGAVPRGQRMKDTPPAVDATYRRMLLARSGEDRLRMAFSMYSTARALVVASILEREPQASPGRLRQGLFLRFYGPDFDAETREQILARLADDARLRRRVPVDWGELEIALTWQLDEYNSYLDVATGNVVSLAIWTQDEDGEATEEQIDEGLAEGRLIPIERLPSQDMLTQPRDTRVDINPQQLDAALFTLRPRYSKRTDPTLHYLMETLP